jgi:hemoglobin
MRRAPRLLVVAALLWIGPAAAEDGLYQELGGRPRIEAFTGTFVDLMAHDDRIKAKFEDTNLARLKQRLTDQLCQLTGGPAAYKGRDMAAAHKALGITVADFNAAVEDLQAAMDQAGIPFFTQNRLLAILAPMERDIVTK